MINLQARCSAGWRGLPRLRISIVIGLLAATIVVAAMTPASNSFAQSTSSGQVGASSPQPTGSGARGGVTIQVDPAALLAAIKGRGESRTVPADWLQLPQMQRPLGDGAVGRYGGYLGFTPLQDGGAAGVRIDLIDPKAGRTHEEAVYVPPSGGKAVFFNLDGETTAGKPPCPCPEAVELARLKAEIERQKTAAPAPNPPCPPPSGPAPAQPVQPPPSPQTTAQPPVPAAQPAPSHPGAGAKSISIPLGHTFVGAREIDHPWWDVIRLHVSGNHIWVTNGTGEWLAGHPEVPPDAAEWVRNNLGVIPTGGIDFGSLGGFSIQDHLEHLCEPPPSLEELEKFKTVDQGFSVLQSEQSQAVVTQFNGPNPAQRPTVKEKSLTVSLTAACHWTYDAATGEVRHETLVTLAVQWTGKDGEVHEVVQTARDPQVSWFVK